MAKILAALSVLLVPWSISAGQLLTFNLKDSRQIIWQKEMDPGEPVRIVHRNSIYGALVWEAFELDDQGFLRLVGIKTDRPAVLEYYGLEDSSSNWIPMDRKFACLTLRVTRSGGFRVFAGKETVPLSQRVADGSQVEISGGKACK